MGRSWSSLYACKSRCSSCGDALTATQGSSPRPLREHLALNFPSSVPLSASTSLGRQSYHARLMTNAQPLFADVNRSSSDLSSLPSPSTSFRKTPVRIPSPLRLQLDDEEDGSRRSEGSKATTLSGYGGLLSPPASPEDLASRSSVMDRGRPIRARSSTEAGLWASSHHRAFSGLGKGLGVISPPSSPPLVSTEKRKTNTGTPVRSPSISPGLWADLRSSPLSSLSAQLDVELGQHEHDAPKFSRSSLRKPGVIMPIAASRTHSPSSSRVTGRSNSPFPSSSSPSSSSSSLASSSSSRSIKTIRRAPSSQDRLASIGQTTQNELPLNEQSLVALQDVSPPHPGFKRRSSLSSLSSDASDHSMGSMGSLTSASSAVTSSLDPYDRIIEEDGDIEVQILGAKRDGDADAEGSVESASMRSGHVPVQTRKKGGIFRRMSQALKR